MAKSSRHKSSHKQSKHSSKEARDYSSDSEEDVKVKDRSGKGESSVRASRDSAVGVKRKASSQSRDGHGDASEEHVSSKRRKDCGEERVDVAGAVSEKVGRSGSSRHESEKSSRSKAESKSRSSRRSENGSYRKEEIVEIVDEKVGSKLKDVKENQFGRIEAAAVKEKERGSDRDRKVKDKKQHDAEKHTDYIESKKKPKVKSSENTEQPNQDDLLKPELEKEAGKRIKSGDGSVERDKHLDNKRADQDRKMSTRREHAKDGRYKEDNHNDGSYKDSYRDDVDRESRRRDGKQKEETDRDGRHKNGKPKEETDRDGRHRDGNQKEDIDRDGRHRDGNQKEDIDRDGRHRDGKQKEETDRDCRHKDDKQKEDIDRDGRHKDGKQRENYDRNSRQRDGKQVEDFDKDDRHRDSKQREDGDREKRYREDKYRDEYMLRDHLTDRDYDKDARHRDSKQREDGDREKRYREDKYRDEYMLRDHPTDRDFDKDARHRDSKHSKLREDGDREKRYREDKYRDEYVLRDHSSDKFDTKRTRDESSYTESRSRKSKSQHAKHDGSPAYSDEDTRYKDDKGRRRVYGKEDGSDIRSQKDKEQYADAGNKNMGTSKTGIVNDRERPYSRNADTESNTTCNRRAYSPSLGSHSEKDRYRHSKQAELKYKDLSPEERVTNDTNSYVDTTGSFGVSEKAPMSRPRERLNCKDDGSRHGCSAERYLKSDAPTSPSQLVDDSSPNIHHRCVVEAGVRQSSDAEEFGHRIKDANGLFNNESKMGSDLPSEAPSVDAVPQVDRGNFSPSSPISRTSHLPGNSRPHFHSSPSLKTAKDSPSAGSFEEDTRGRSNNRYKRSGNSNMGRARGNAWSGVPNWSSPVTGSFVRFQNGPPAVGFHPMMQQFSGPQMYGMRPLVEFTHSRGPYPIPDANGFSTHGHPFRWPKPIDDSCPPLAHGWDVKNGGEAHNIYGGLEWDHNRSPMNGHGWDASADMLKGRSGLVTVDMPSTTEKEDLSVLAPSDEISAAQSIQQTRNELNELNFEAENNETNQPSDGLAKETYKSPNITTAKKYNLSHMSQNVDACYCHVYLSKLDISADLSHPDVYDKCRNLLDMKQSEITTNGSSHSSYIEEVIEARVKIAKDSSKSSLFVTELAINNSVFQKAIQFYEKQREEMKACLPSLSNGKKFSLYSANTKASPDSDRLNKPSSPVSNPTASKLDEKKEPPAVPREKADPLVAANSPEALAFPIPPAEEEEKEVVKVINEEKPKFGVDDKVPVSQASEFAPKAPHCSEDEDLCTASNSSGFGSADNVTDQELLDSTSGQILLSNVPSEEGKKVLMPRTILECGSVNLTGIHSSSESTH